MVSKLFRSLEPYERHLSALAMLAGFIADNLFFTRIDLWQTQVLFAVYTVVCFISIPLLHFLELRPSTSSMRSHLRFILPIITQFALGGFWSGFVIFYGRSAVLSVSWPFLIFLVLVFLGSEYFHRYHARLVFTSILFFFALYLYTIFALPLYTGSISTVTFLMSGVVAISSFALFIALLRAVARERFLQDIWRVRVGAVFVIILINTAYFSAVIPPLPLSAESAGIYHDVVRVPGAYRGTREVSEPWQVRYLNFTETLHIPAGASVAAYSSIFAPTALLTTITHRWQWYDPQSKAWVTRSTIAYPILGGRDGGYRGYSEVPITSAGQWRVVVETSDARVIARIPFNIEFVATAVPLQTITLP